MSAIHSKSRITVIVPKEVARSLKESLVGAGVNQLSVNSGRSPFLQERKGFASVFGDSSLVSSPVELISFFVDSNEEGKAMRFVIEKGNLQIPGRGSVFSESMEIVDSHQNCRISSDPSFEASESRVPIFNDLTAISCIVQRGQADEIAKIMLSRGIVPTIFFGEGTGIRDRLGLLRITIPKEKEILHVVVGSYDSEYVMNTMIHAGRLDRPGRGFISQSRVSRGLINAKSVVGASGHAASIAQIVSTIDKMEGGMTWRQDNQFQKIETPRQYLSGFDVFIYTNEGYALPVAKKAMDVGVSGATISHTSLVQSDSADQVSNAREVCKMMIPENMKDEVLSACQSAFSDEAQGMYFTCPVSRAFTYINSNSKTS